MLQKRLFAVILILAAIGVGYFADIRLSAKPAFPYVAVTVNHANYKLGLDLNGGTHLVYQANTSKLTGADVGGAMTALRDVIERRVNIFGVSEPIVQIEKGGVVGGGDDRLIVELPGVTNVEDAIKTIGQVPTLEFKTERLAGAEKDAILKAFDDYQKTKDSSKPIISNLLAEDPYYISSPLTGRYLEHATVEFDPTTGEPHVSITFNSVGAKLFGDLTKNNVNKTIAVYLDGAIISAPVVREEIKDGKAVISGGFKVADAQALARNLNYGALPVDIKLLSTQTIGASLGEDALNAGIKSGLIAFAVIALFLILWYRLPGLVAVLALSVYVVLNLLIFKFLVTLTAAGIAGFILSIGMAVDANILIFERMKEELARGRALPDAVREGFARAWTSIRDSNLSSIITSVILYWFASNSLIKGFALVFFIGVVTSMFTAIVISRTFLQAIGAKGDSKFAKFLFRSGFLNPKP
ncbi:MAG: protein translocase subunit SecD [Patescibacteria group bacterium]